VQRHERVGRQNFPVGVDVANPEITASQRDSRSQNEKRVGRERSAASGNGNGTEPPGTVFTAKRASEIAVRSVLVTLFVAIDRPVAAHTPRHRESRANASATSIVYRAGVAVVAGDVIVRRFTTPVYRAGVVGTLISVVADGINGNENAIADGTRIDRAGDGIVALYDVRAGTRVEIAGVNRAGSTIVAKGHVGIAGRVFDAPFVDTISATTVAVDRVSVFALLPTV